MRGRLGLRLPRVSSDVPRSTPSAPAVTPAERGPRPAPAAPRAGLTLPAADSGHPDAGLRERPLERRTVFEGRLLTLHADTVETPRGARAGREVVDHPGAVAIVARDAQGRVLLVRQWRHAVGRAVWEIPAGTLGRGEDPERAARRELSEETGYTAASWRRLTTGPVAPGYSGELLHLFAAAGLVPGEPHTDPDETVVARLFSAAEVGHLVAAGEVDVKTCAGLWLVGFPRRAEAQA